MARVPNTKPSESRQQAERELSTIEEITGPGLRINLGLSDDQVKAFIKDFDAQIQAIGAKRLK